MFRFLLVVHLGESDRLAADYFHRIFQNTIAYCFKGVGDNCMLVIEPYDSLTLDYKRATNIQAKGENHVALTHNH